MLAVLRILRAFLFHAARWRKKSKNSRIETGYGRIAILILVITACNKPPVSEVVSPTCYLPDGEKGVVIGGSIAEGSPLQRGAKHGQCENKPGQISFWLQEFMKMPVINQAIAGQDCQTIMERWRIDVELLHPSFVWFQCGHNDFKAGGDVVGRVKAAYWRAMQSSAELGFTLFIVTLGYNPSAPQENEKIDLINRWMYLQASVQGIVVVPYDQWANENLGSPEVFVDNLHPSGMGIDFMMSWLQPFVFPNWVPSNYQEEIYGNGDAGTDTEEDEYVVDESSNPASTVDEPKKKKKKKRKHKRRH